MTKYRRIAPPSLNVPEIRETGAFVPDDDPHMIFVEAEAKGGTVACPECGSVHVYRHGTAQTRYIHDVSIGIDRVDILLKNERFKCQEPECGRVFTRKYKFINDYLSLTNRLVKLIEQESVRKSFSSVATEFGVTIPTVEAVFNRHCKELEEDRKAPVAPRVLGIDENHIANRMRGVLTDIETGRLLDITEDRSMPTMKEAIMELQDYQDIEIVTMDMYTGYKTVIEEILPDAAIIIDKFHVVQNLQRGVNDAKKQLTQILKAEVKELPEGPEKARKELLLTKYGKNTYLFKYGRKTLLEKEGQLSLMADLCRTFPRINELRMLKEKAEKIYDTDSRKEASKALTEWIAAIPKKDPVYAKMRTTATSARKLRKEILNYFDHEQFTNAATEGVNSLIKQLNSVGRGYSFENLRYKVLFFPDSHKRTIISRKRPDLPTKLTEEDVVNMVEDGIIKPKDAMMYLEEHRLDPSVYRKIRAERSRRPAYPMGFTRPGQFVTPQKPKRTRPTIHRHQSTGYQIDIQTLITNVEDIF